MGGGGTPSPRIRRRNDSSARIPPFIKRAMHARMCMNVLSQVWLAIFGAYIHARMRMPCPQPDRLRARHGPAPFQVPTPPRPPTHICLMPGGMSVGGRVLARWGKQMKPCPKGHGTTSDDVSWVRGSNGWACLGRQADFMRGGDWRGGVVRPPPAFVGGMIHPREFPLS